MSLKRRIRNLEKQQAPERSFGGVALIGPDRVKLGDRELSHAEYETYKEECTGFLIEVQIVYSRHEPE